MLPFQVIIRRSASIPRVPGRGFHVVGTFDNGNIQFADSSVTAAVFERRKQDGIRPEVDDALDIGIHAVADVDNASVPAAFLDLGKFDVFQTAYSANAFQLVEFRPQAAVYRRIDDRLLQGEYVRRFLRAGGSGSGFSRSASR